MLENVFEGWFVCSFSTENVTEKTYYIYYRFKIVPNKYIYFLGLLTNK